MRVAVVGGGIIGQVTALHLAEQGHTVTLIAPETEDHAASYGNAGTIADYALDPVATPDVLRDAPRLLFDRMSPLAIHRPTILSTAPWLARFLWAARPARVAQIRQTLASLLHDAAPLWLALSQRLGAGALMRRGDAIYGYDTPAAFERARAALAPRIALGARVEWMDADALQSSNPGLPAGRFAGGARFTDTLWTVDPGAIMARLGAEQPAARINARAHALHPIGQGWHVLHDQGDTDADAVVLAAGAWSGQLLRPLGVRLPLTAERGYHLEFDLDQVEMPVGGPFCPTRYGYYLTPMAGRLRAAGTVELGGIGAPPSPHRWAMLEAGVRDVLPDLPAPSRRWMGLRPSMPDSLPVIGAARPGLIVAFGHGHLGLTLAPRTARLVEAALSGAPQGDDAAILPALSPARFRASGATG